MQDTRDRSDLYIRVKATTIESVLNDGRFKSQFETKTSQGFLDTESPSHGIRGELEERLFGYKSNTDAKNRPVYGYLSDGDGLDESVWQYGDVAVKLKKDQVRKRTTLTHKDSLSDARDSRVARLFDDADERMVKIEDFGFLRAQKTAELDFLDYFEAQYHGGITLDDIEHVVFTPDAINEFNDNKKKRLKSLLKKKKVKFFGL